MVRSDSWLDALTKLVPGEVIVGYTGALQVNGVADDSVAHLTILVLFTCLAPVVLWRSARQVHSDVPWLQYTVRTLAFVLYALGSDRFFMESLGHLQWIPGVGAFAVVLLAALVIVPPGAHA